MKVSVVMAAYNYGRYIEEAIGSVLQQTHADLELLVIDDGSTDDTPGRMAAITDPRVRYVRTVNQGVAAARNTGLDLATGDVLATLDADDRWLPRMLERQVGILAAEPEVVSVFTNFRRFEDSGRVYPDDQFTFYPELRTFPSRPARSGFGTVLLGDSFQHFLTATDPPGFPTAIAFRRSVVGSLRFNRDPSIWPVEDMQYMFRAFLLGPVAYNPEPLGELRRHGSNATADLSVIPRAKLRSFETLEQEALSPAQRSRLEERTLRSRFDIALAHTRSREWGQSAAATIEALVKPGPLPRKLRGTVSVALSVARNLVGREAAFK